MSGIALSTRIVLGSVFLGIIIIPSGIIRIGENEKRYNLGACFGTFYTIFNEKSSTVVGNTKKIACGANLLEIEVKTVNILCVRLQKNRAEGAKFFGVEKRG